MILTTLRSRISMNCARLTATSAFQRHGSADACGSPGLFVSTNQRVCVVARLGAARVLGLVLGRVVAERTAAASWR
jgi:hypothetical protein